MEEHLATAQVADDTTEPLAHAIGYPYTHYDCPHCGAALEFEGDTRGETLTCDSCQREFEG